MKTIRNNSKSFIGILLLILGIGAGVVGVINMSVYVNSGIFLAGVVAALLFIITGGVLLLASCKEQEPTPTLTVSKMTTP